MGKINGCLRCLFIFFNVLYAILGCVLIFGTAKLTGYSQQLSTVGSPGLGWCWVFAIGVLCISCLGIYAGCSEKTLALKIFAGFMGVGMVIMLIFGIIVAVAKNKVRDGFRDASSEIVHAIMQDETTKASLEELQQTAQCCGVVRAEDWGTKIPYSCDCKSSGGFGGYGGFGGFGTSGCISRPQGATGPDQVYSKPCSDIILMYINIFFQIFMGFFFGFAVTALLGLLISLLMVHQVNRHDGTGGASIAMKGY